MRLDDGAAGSRVRLRCRAGGRRDWRPGYPGLEGRRGHQGTSVALRFLAFPIVSPHFRGLAWWEGLGMVCGEEREEREERGGKR